MRGAGTKVRIFGIPDNIRGSMSARHFLNIPAVYRMGTRWIGNLPLWLSYGLSNSIADASYLLYRPAVQNVMKNLQRALPDMSGPELKALTHRLFRNYGQYLVDYGRFTHLDPLSVASAIPAFEGQENLDEALRMNRGVILLTAHLGNWELGGIFFSGRGIPINVVTAEDPNEEIDEVRRWYRERHRVNTITVGNSPFATMEMMQALRRNEMVAMLIDRHDPKMEGIQADFFGRKTMFPRGPFLLSRISGAPIILAFVVRDGRGYKGIVEKPVLVDREECEIQALRETVQLLERYIILYASQWYNFIPI